MFCRAFYLSRSVCKVKQQNKIIWKIGVYARLPGDIKLNGFAFAVAPDLTKQLVRIIIGRNNFGTRTLSCL